MAGPKRASSPTAWRADADGLVLHVRLTPKAARDSVDGLVSHGGATYLAVRVRAIPDKGAANAALERLLADWLGLAQSDVRLTAGGKSRLKTLALAGDPARLARTIEARLGA